MNTIELRVAQSEHFKQSTNYVFVPYNEVGMEIEIGNPHVRIVSVVYEEESIYESAVRLDASDLKKMQVLNLYKQPRIEYSEVSLKTISIRDGKPCLVSPCTGMPTEGKWYDVVHMYVRGYIDDLGDYTPINQPK